MLKSRSTPSNNSGNQVENSLPEDIEELKGQLNETTRDIIRQFHEFLESDPGNSIITELLEISRSPERVVQNNMIRLPRSIANAGVTTDAKYYDELTYPYTITNVIRQQLMMANPVEESPLPYGSLILDFSTQVTQKLSNLISNKWSRVHDKLSLTSDYDYGTKNKLCLALICYFFQTDYQVADNSIAKHFHIAKSFSAPLLESELGTNAVLIAGKDMHELLKDERVRNTIRNHSAANETRIGDIAKLANRICQDYFINNMNKYLIAGQYMQREIYDQVTSTLGDFESILRTIFDQLYTIFTAGKETERIDQDRIFSEELLIAVWRTSHFQDLSGPGSQDSGFNTLRKEHGERFASLWQHVPKFLGQKERATSLISDGSDAHDHLKRIFAAQAGTDLGNVELAHFKRNIKNTKVTFERFLRMVKNHNNTLFAGYDIRKPQDLVTCIGTDQRILTDVDSAEQAILDILETDDAAGLTDEQLINLINQRVFDGLEWFTPELLASLRDVKSTRAELAESLRKTLAYSDSDPDGEDVDVDVDGVDTIDPEANPEGPTPVVPILVAEARPQAVDSRITAALADIEKLKTQNSELRRRAILIQTHEDRLKSLELDITAKQKAISQLTPKLDRSSFTAISALAQEAKAIQDQVKEITALLESKISDFSFTNQKLPDILAVIQDKFVEHKDQIAANNASIQQLEQSIAVYRKELATERLMPIAQTIEDVALVSNLTKAEVMTLLQEMLNQS